MQPVPGDRSVMVMVMLMLVATEPVALGGPLWITLGSTR